MKLIQAPEIYRQQPGEISLFLAGGITGFWDWYKEFTEGLSNTDLVLLNPKRADFDINDSSLAERQIRWEYNHLRVCSMVSFWFTADTLQPITLFELGSLLTSNKKLFVGTDLKYARRFDVVTQLRLRNPNITVRYNIRDVVNDIKAYIYN